MQTELKIGDKVVFEVDRPIDGSTDTYKSKLEGIVFMEDAHHPWLEILVFIPGKGNRTYNVRREFIKKKGNK